MLVDMADKLKDRRPLLSYLRVQADRERRMLAILGSASTRIDSELRRLQSRSGVGAGVRLDQLGATQASINREMGSLWRTLGDEIAAGRSEAAAAAVESMHPPELLRSVFPERDLDYLMRSARETAARGIDAVEARQNLSYVPLSESVYNNQALARGEIDEIINSAIARGASAAELARDVRDYVRPDTPGGVKYAANRLGRTELNNAFHAQQVHSAQKTPWTTHVRWHLSGSHPKPDECNDYAETSHVKDGEAGVWRPEDVPMKPHPNCLCFTTPETVNRQEFMAQFEAGKYDDYLDDQFPDLPRLKSTVSSTPTSTARPIAPQTPFPTMSANPRQDYRALLRERSGGVHGYNVPPGLEYYKGYGYSPMNSFLRGNSKPMAMSGKPAPVTKVKSSIKSMDAEFKRGVKLKSDTTVQRGLRDVDLSSYRDGEFLVEAGYTSATMDTAIANRFARGELMGSGPGDGWVVDVLVPKDTKVVLPGNVGGEEFEMLLPRNSKYKVHAIDETRKKIWMELVK